MTESELLKKLIFYRREIHKYPEMGNQEFKTANFVEKILKELKIPSRRLTKTGVLATLKGSGSGKCVALRADMDALPLHEKNSKPYKSRHPGVMHACGHDAHVAMLLGAGTLLRDEKFSGTIKLMFQPNEEGAGGAEQLIDQNILKSPKVDSVFGLHVNPRLPVGSVGLKPGPLMAAVDKFTIEITGKGGHAAYPHEGTDAIPIACEAVQALQTIVSRKTDPLDSVVLTVGTINGGSRFNILAGSVSMTGTVRTLSERVHQKVPKLLRQVLDGICKAHGAKFTLQYEVLGSVLSNDPKAVDLAGRVAQNLFGRGRVLSLDRASMGGEDFSEYLKYAPGCFIYIGTGSASPDRLVPWHHPEFDMDERALPVGSRLLAGVALEALQS